MPGERGDNFSPTGFYYKLDNDRMIYLYPYVIGDNTGQDPEYHYLAFNTLGDILRTNMTGANNIGANNLEIELVITDRLEGENIWWTSSPIIDIIYVPFPRMDWKGAVTESLAVEE